MSEIGYHEFGARFIRRAVTAERVAKALGGFAGKGMRLGPISLGPGRFVRVSAEGVVKTPTVAERVGDLAVFDVAVPVSLSLRLRVGQETSYHADVTVGLVLTARPAAPLLLVIDIPPVSARDIRLELRGSGLGAALLPFVEVLEREIRSGLASRVNALLNEPSTRASRVVDIAARIDGRPDDAPPARFEWLSPAEFGDRFFRHAVTERRIAAEVADLKGREVSIGPLRAGPRDVATVSATGVVGAPTVAANEGELVTMRVRIPLDLDLAVTVSRALPYRAAIVITLELVARAADELSVVIDIPPIDASTVAVELTSRGVLGRLVGSIGDIEGQIREHVAAYVNRETAEPTVVDVAARIDAA